MPTPVAVKLDEDVQVRVKALAAVRDRSPHWLMREAIRHMWNVRKGAKYSGRTVCASGKFTRRPGCM